MCPHPVRQSVANERLPTQSWATYQPQPNQERFRAAVHRPQLSAEGLLWGMMIGTVERAVVLPTRKDTICRSAYLY